MKLNYTAKPSDKTDVKKALQNKREHCCIRNNPPPIIHGSGMSWNPSEHVYVHIPWKYINNLIISSLSFCLQPKDHSDQKWQDDIYSHALAYWFSLELNKEICPLKARINAFSILNVRERRPYCPCSLYSIGQSAKRRQKHLVLFFIEINAEPYLKSVTEVTVSLNHSGSCGMLRSSTTYMANKESV